MFKTATTRAEALELGLSFYETGRPCIHGHFSKRYASTGGCLQCLRGSTPVSAAIVDTNGLRTVEYRNTSSRSVFQYRRRADGFETRVAPIRSPHGIDSYPWAPWAPTDADGDVVRYLAGDDPNAKDAAPTHCVVLRFVHGVSADERAEWGAYLRQCIAQFEDSRGKVVEIA